MSTERIVSSTRPQTNRPPCDLPDWQLSCKADHCNTCTGPPTQQQPPTFSTDRRARSGTYRPNLYEDPEPIATFSDLPRAPVTQLSQTSLKLSDNPEPTQRSLWGINFTPTNSPETSVSFKDIFVPAEAFSFSQSLHFCPDQLRHALARFRSHEHLQPRSKHFSTSIKDLSSQIPVALSILGLHQSLGIKPHQPLVPKPHTPEQLERLALGNAFHDSFAAIQAALAFIKSGRPLRYSLPTLPGSEITALQTAINQAQADYLGVTDSSGPDFTYTIWQYFTRNRSPLIHPDDPRAGRLLDPQAPVTQALATYLWHTHTGRTILHPESHPHFDKRHEARICLFVHGETGLITFMQNDIIFLSRESKPEKNGHLKHTYTAGFSDIKSTELLIERRTHPFVHDTFLLTTMLMLAGTYELLQSYHYPHVFPYTPPKKPKDYTWVTRNKISPPTQRHHLSARFLRLQVDDTGEVQLVVHELKPTREDWQVFSEIMPLIGQTLRSIPIQNLNSKIKGFLQTEPESLTYPNTV